jgi:drug/metabolite transporter (DMT)-like permease
MWGVSDYLGGVRTRTLSAVTVTLVVEIVGLLGMVTVVGLIGVPGGTLAGMGWASGAGVAGVLALVALYRAMADGQISVVAPISACGAALPVVIGLASGERPGVLSLAGIVLALAGCALASRPPSEESHHGSRRSIGLALVAAIGVGLYLTGMRYAVEADGVWWPLMISRTAAVVAVLAVLVRRAPLPRRRDLPLIMPVAVTDLGATVAYAGAATSGLLALDAVLADLYPVVSVLLARVNLGERLNRTQAAGVVFALLGVCLMATP